MKFFVIEVDQDYHTISDSYFKDFENKETAEKWCKDHSWGGYDYFLVDDKEIRENL